MSSPIRGAGSGKISTGGASLHSAQQASNASTTALGEEVENRLFARVPPKLANPDAYADLLALLQWLEKRKRQIAILRGDKPEEYTLVLAEGGNAAIDADGVIFFGASLLRAYQDERAVLVGILAHEIGHRPKRWKEACYRQSESWTQAQIEQICRHEETRADLFAGMALAELGFPCHPLCEFLRRAGDGPRPHREYFPEAVRRDVIWGAWRRRMARMKARKRHFPKYHRGGTHADIGEY